MRRTNFSASRAATLRVGERRAGDEGPVSSPRLETTGKLQLAIRAGHRVDGQAEIGGELTDRREPDGGEKSTTVDGGGNLCPDLLKRGHRRVGIQGNKINQINQIRLVHALIVPAFVSAMLSMRASGPAVDDPRRHAATTLCDDERLL